jgi:cell division protein FtsW (lipid II flippase)
LIGPFALTFLAMILILLEPDLGTVILMMPILFAMLFAAGAKGWHLLLIIGLAIVTSPILWMSMHDYQRMRISSLVLQNAKIRAMARHNPTLAKILVGRPERLYNWKEGGGYQLLQSKQAIASGGVTGYGFARGPYVQDDFFFLPDKHNDFIFAVIAHQFGLIGCTGVILLYAMIIGAGMEIAWRNTDPFGRLVAVGITTMFAVQVFVNISMTLGLMPITGLTLPFVSYGGSSLMTSFMGIGLLNSIGRWRPFSVAKKPFEFKPEGQ